MLASTHCAICRSPLPPHQARLAPLCGSASCRYRFDHLTETERCQGCRRALSPEEIPLGICVDPACRRLVRDRESAKERARVENLARHADELRGHNADAHRYRLALIPAYLGHLVPLSDERRQNFREVLLAAIDQAFTGDPATDPSDLVRLPVPTPLSEEVRVVFAQACGVCRGRCCQFGADHAFINAKVIRRYAVSHPGVTADQIAADYLGRLHLESCDNSCVYHGVEGCALPRDMRSHICNEALCPALQQFADQVEEGDSPNGFFAATAGESVVEAAFVDASGTTRCYSARK